MIASQNRDVVVSSISDSVVIYGISRESPMGGKREIQTDKTAGRLDDADGEVERLESEALRKLRQLTTAPYQENLSLVDLAHNLKTTSGPSPKIEVEAVSEAMPMTEMARRLQEQCSNVMSRRPISTLSSTIDTSTRPPCRVLWGCRYRPFVKIPAHIHVANLADLHGSIDYSMMLKILWNDYSVDAYKYVAVVAAKILTSALDINDCRIQATKWRTRKTISSLYRMHLTDIGFLLQKEALSNVSLDIHLKILREEDVKLIGLFTHKDIAPYFQLIPSAMHPSDNLLILNTDRICQDARRKMARNCRNGILERRLNGAISILKQIGIIL